MINGEGLIGEE